MKLTPLEILQYLGINVPPEGLTINPNDAFLYTQFLSVLGKGMTVDSIPDSALVFLDTGLRNIAAQARDGGEPPTADQLERFRTSLRVIQRNDLGMAVE